MEELELRGGATTKTNERGGGRSQSFSMCGVGEEVSRSSEARRCLVK